MTRVPVHPEMLRWACERAGHDDGEWLLVSDTEDQQEHPPVPWPEDAKVIGAA